VASPTSPQAPELLDVTLPSLGSASLFAATHTLASRENTSASIIQREASEMDEERARSSRVLLFDDGSGGALLRFHKRRNELLLGRLASRGSSPA
jgi:hypothetical protein